MTIQYDSYGIPYDDGTPDPNAPPPQSTTRPAPPLDPNAGIPGVPKPKGGGKGNVAAVNAAAGGQNFAGMSKLVPGIPDAFLYGTWWKDNLAGSGIDSTAGRRAYLMKKLHEDPRFADSVRQAFDNLRPVEKQRYLDGAAHGNPWDPMTDPDEFAAEETRRLGDQEQDALKFTEEEFLGTKIATLEDLMAKATAGSEEARLELEKKLGGFQDPEIEKYVGDMISQAATAGADPRDIEAQQRQLALLEERSTLDLLPGERAFLEESRLQNEMDLRAKREAQNENWMQRGVYGSGAEIVGTAMDQQGYAQRQAMEFLKAQQTAQERAMSSLEGASELSTKMRDSSALESQKRGEAADRATELSKTLKDGYDKWVYEQKAKAVAAGRTAATESFTRKVGGLNKPVEDYKLTLPYHDPKRSTNDLIKGDIGVDVTYAGDIGGIGGRDEGTEKIEDA